jgi:predicted acetyltransferase
VSTRTLQVDYGPPTRPEEAAELVRILTWSFAVPEERLTKALEQIGHENLRILREQGRLAAGYILYAMGQWFGGRRVSMGGVGMVGVAPEARGSGVATRLMEATIRECHASGFAISTLYPAKQVLYRRSGYERAGTRCRVEVDLERLVPADRDGERGRVRAFVPGDVDAIRALYDRSAAAENGMLDRSPFLWDRRMRLPDHEVRGFVIEGASGPEGYAFLYQDRTTDPRTSVHVTDQIAVTPAAVRSIIDLYGDHRSMGSYVEWYGRLSDPLLMMLRETRTKVELHYPWMIRVVDVHRALEERGYPAGLEAELHLAVKDELIAANDDRFVVRIGGGRAEVRRGGEGRIAMGIRGLAPIWSGFLTPLMAKRCGLLDGPDDELTRAAAAFAGPAPWMPDMF